MKRFFSAIIALSLLSAVLLGGCTAAGDLLPSLYAGDRVLNPLESNRITEPDFVDFSVNRSFYEALDAVQQQAYRLIYNSVFSFPAEIRIPKLTEAQLSEVMLAVKYDNPYVIFLDSSYTYSAGAGQSRVFPDYVFTAQKARSNIDRLLNRAKELIAGIPADADDFARELYLHDRLCEGCAYADGADADTAFGALISGSAVCEGYALAAKLLFDLAGLPACVVKGRAKSDSVPEATHMWNAVRIGGRWYYLDCTWDDPVVSGGGDFVRHAYFNLDAETLDRTHFRYTVPQYIVCDAAEDNYFRRMGLYCTEDDWTDVVRQGIASADRSRGAEFGFSSAELLREAASRLFEDGGIAAMVSYEPNGRISYSLNEDTCTLHVGFGREER